MNNKYVNNNYKSEGFGMQRSKDDMSGILVESLIVFAKSSRVFAQSLELFAQLAKKSIWTPDLFSQLINKWAYLVEGVQGK